MKQADRTVIQKMIDYCDQVDSLRTRFGDHIDSFRQDFAYQYAAGMCILQIGELVNRLSPEALSENVQIPWRLIRATQNVYAHDYERTKLETIWQTMTEDIPVLRRQLKSILEK